MSNTNKRKIDEIDEINVNLDVGSEKFIMMPFVEKQINRVDEIILDNFYFVRLRLTGLTTRSDYIGKVVHIFNGVVYFKPYYERLARVDDIDPYNHWEGVLKSQELTTINQKLINAKECIIIELNNEMGKILSKSKNFNEVAEIIKNKIIENREINAPYTDNFKQRIGELPTDIIKSFLPRDPLTGQEVYKGGKKTKKRRKVKQVKRTNKKQRKNKKKRTVRKH
jgi:hypothetical protein